MCFWSLEHISTPDWITIPSSSTPDWKIIQSTSTKRYNYYQMRDMRSQVTSSKAICSYDMVQETLNQFQRQVSILVPSLASTPGSYTSEQEPLSPYLRHQHYRIIIIIHSWRACSRWPWAFGCWAFAPPSFACLQRPSGSKRSGTAPNSHRKSLFFLHPAGVLPSPSPRRLCLTPTNRRLHSFSPQKTWFHALQQKRANDR